MGARPANIDPVTKQLEPIHCNAASFDRRRSGGHYESWFCRANHPSEPRAFWIRYTIFAPKKKGERTEGELWAVYFDGDRIRRATSREPIDRCRFGASEAIARIGDATLHDDRLVGAIEADKHGEVPLSWNLTYGARDRPPVEPLYLLPKLLYSPRSPTAKALVSAPFASFSGALVVGGETILVDDWIGSQCHNWGRKHTDSYYWGQVVGFEHGEHGERVFLECVTAQIKLGGITVPPATMAVVREGDRIHRANGLVSAFLARTHRDRMTWSFDVRGSGVRIEAEFVANDRCTVDLEYRNPPGKTKTCSNSKTGRCTLTIHEGSAQRTYATQHRAALEVLDDHCYGCAD